MAVPLSELPDGVHVTRLRETEPVDILRTGRTVVVRSLFCPHMGCIVRWEAAAAGFKCPCHGGAFDADGHPVSGPPPGPLRLMPIQLEADRVVILRRPRVT